MEYYIAEPFFLTGLIIAKCLSFYKSLGKKWFAAFGNGLFILLPGALLTKRCFANSPISWSCDWPDACWSAAKLDNGICSDGWRFALVTWSLFLCSAFLYTQQYQPVWYPSDKGLFLDVGGQGIKFSFKDSQFGGFLTIFIKIKINLFTPFYEFPAYPGPSSVFQFFARTETGTGRMGIVYRALC